MNQITVWGNDGKSPIFKTDTKWTEWNYNEIYLGEEGNNKFVASLNDGVVKYDTQQRYKVIAVDQLTLIPTLDEIVTQQPGEFTRHEMLMGVGPITSADTYRVYLNTDVFPHTLNVDKRLKIHGSTSSTIMLFKLANISDTGEVISQDYDHQGHLVDNKVNLETVAVENMTNYAVKSVPTFYTNQYLPDGEITTIVAYDDVGHVVFKRQLLVENTNYVRRPEMGIRYIDNISLDSPFISTTEPEVIRLPLNINVSSLGLTGIVNYSDGKKIERGVDGNMFEIFGLNNFIATIIGQEIDLVLSYRLQAGENTQSLVTVDNKKLTKHYTLIVDDPINVYSVKLMGYPEWQGSVSGYKMRWWLVNLDRTLCEDVTNKVTYNNENGVFDPKAYGVLQRLIATVKMSDVLIGVKPYLHVQPVDIILEAVPDTINSVWQVDMDIVDNTLPYGKDVIAKKDSVSNELDITLGLTNLKDWLEKMYYQSSPLKFKPNDNTPFPVPTHIEVMYQQEILLKDLSEWPLSPILFANSVAFNNNVYVKFIEKTGNNNRILGISGMLVTT